MIGMAKDIPRSFERISSFGIGDESLAMKGRGKNEWSEGFLKQGRRRKLRVYVADFKLYLNPIFILLQEAE